MNQIKSYFQTPLSALAKTQIYDEEIQNDNETQKKHTSYIIIFSGLNETKREKFLVPEKLTESQNTSWKNNFTWL